LLEKLLVIASIEAPLTFLQEPVKIVGFDAVETPHMPFGLVPEILDAIDVVLLVGEELRMIDAQMMKVGYIKRIVRLKRVRINDAIGRNFLFDDRHQSLGLCIGYNRGKNLPAPF